MVGCPAACRRRNPGDGDASSPQCRHHIGPEDLRPVVVVIKGDPDHGGGIGACCGPRGHGHGLAGARRPGDHGQRAPHALREEPVDLRAANRPAGHARHRDLGNQDRIASARPRFFRAGGRGDGHAGGHSNTPCFGRFNGRQDKLTRRARPHARWASPSHRVHCYSAIPY